jgi:hypothetical protein
MQPKPLINTNRAVITCARDSLCEQWLKLTKELHGLSEGEMVLAGKFLDKRIELKEKITDDDLLDEYLQSTKVRQLIKEAANVKNSAVFQNMLSNLRKKGFFLTGDKINKAFIPNITAESNVFKVEIIFKITDG